MGGLYFGRPREISAILTFYSAGPAGGVVRRPYEFFGDVREQGSDARLRRGVRFVAGPDYRLTARLRIGRNALGGARGLDTNPGYDLLPRRFCDTARPGVGYLGRGVVGLPDFPAPSASPEIRLFML